MVEGRHQHWIGRTIGFFLSEGELVNGSRSVSHDQTVPSHTDALHCEFKGSLFGVLPLVLYDQTRPDFPDDHSTVSSSRGKHFGTYSCVEAEHLVSRMGILSFGQSFVAPDVEVAI